MAKVTEEKPRLNMVWNGMSIVNISREFLNSNGAEKHQNVHVEKATVWQPQWAGLTFSQKMKNMVGDLNVCSKKGLSERFDSTIGAATVLMPFGGAYQLTPPERHGGKAAGGRRDQHLLRHGMGLQPLPDERQTSMRAHRWPSSRA